MEQQQKLVHIQAMIQLTEYIDSLIKQNSNFSSEQLKQQPLPEVQDQNLSLSKVQKRLQRLMGVNDVTLSEIATTKEVVSSVHIKPEIEISKQPPAESKRVEKAENATYSKMTETQRELYQIMKRLMQKIGKSDQTNWFLGHLCNEAVPNYDVHIAQPMCYQAILTRFACTIEAGVELEICSQGQKNLLVNVQRQDYGSFAEYAVRNLKNAQRNFEIFQKDPYSLGSKTCQNLKNKPRPYKAVAEIVRDFILVFVNCWYYNYQNDAFKKIAAEGMRELYTTFVHAYSEQVWPRWAQWLFTDPKELDDAFTILAKIKKLREWQLTAKEKEYNPDLEMKVQAAPSAPQPQPQPAPVVVKQETAPQPHVQVHQQPEQPVAVIQSANKEELLDFINAHIDDEDLAEKIIDITGGDNVEHLDIQTLIQLKQLIEENQK